MANSFGTDILIQVEDVEEAASFYVDQLGFTVTGRGHQWSVCTAAMSISSLRLELR